MVIGSILLQPRKVAKPAAPAPVALLEDFLALAARIGWDYSHGGQCLKILEAALNTVLSQILAGMKAGEASAQKKIETWAKPFLDRVQALSQNLPKASDAHETLTSGEQLIGLLVELLDGITTDELAKHIDFLFNVLHDDFGVTNEFIDHQVNAILDEAIHQLRTAPPESDAAVKENRLEMAALLSRIRRQIRGQFALPPINVDRLAAPMLEHLRALQYDAWVKRVGVIAGSVKGGLALTGTISEEVTFSMGFGPRGPGAAGAPGAGATKRAWYASYITGDEIKVSDPTTAPALQPYTFKHISADAMEKFTLHSKWVTALIDAGLLIPVGVKRGNYGTALPAIGRDLIVALLAPLADVEVPSWLVYVINGVIALLGSLEGRGFDQYDTLLYFFHVIFKFGGTSLPVDLVRDALISAFTLVNHDPKVSGTPENRNQIDGLVQLFMQVGGALAHAALIPHNYFSVNMNVDNSAGKARHPAGVLIAVILFGGMGASLVSFLAGFTLSLGLAGEAADGKHAGKTLGLGYLQSLAKFIGFWFILNDGNTKDGKLGYLPDQGRGTETAFGGYPDQTTSPYLLPYAKDTWAECVQGNHGFWSHNSVINQTFAYDFSLNLAQDVLCMRDGTVVDFVDNIDDGDHDHDGNHIVIKHVTAAKPTFDAVHDKDAGGVNKITYAVYYHSQKGSIQRAFGGTLPVKGVTEVQQGKVLASCNSTGMSRFNHAHIEVRPDNGGGSPNNYSIPFVYKDAENKGVPQSQTYYKSLNEKKP